jgi:hypothetical protein
VERGKCHNSELRNLNGKTSSEIGEEGEEPSEWSLITGHRVHSMLLLRPLLLVSLSRNDFLIIHEQA